MNILLLFRGYKWSKLFTERGSYYSFKTQVKALDNDEQGDPDFLFLLRCISS